MASFKTELPNDLMKQFIKLEVATPKMIDEMTKAGADVVKNVVKNNFFEIDHLLQKRYRLLK